LQGPHHSAHRSTTTILSELTANSSKFDSVNSYKIKKELGWKPRFEFESALTETVNWYLENRKWIDNIRNGTYRNWIERNYNGRGLE